MVMIVKGQGRGWKPPLGVSWSINSDGKEVTHDGQVEVEVVEENLETISSSDVGPLVLHRVREFDLHSPMSVRA